MWSMQPKVMRGRRPDADDSGSRRLVTGPERLRELARIAGDLGADEMVHDAVALVERDDVTPDVIDAALTRFTDRLVFEIDERRAALMRPPALSGSHSAELRASIVNAQQWLRDLSTEADVSEERLRLSRERFLGNAREAEVEATKDRKKAIAQANDLAVARVREWAAQMAAEVRALHAAAVEKHAAAIHRLAERIREAGVPIEDDIAVDTEFIEPAVEPHRVTLPFRWRKPPIAEEARDVFQQALAIGSQQVVDAFHEAMTLARRRLEWEIALRLRATADSLKRAAETARIAQGEGAPGIANELNRLDDLSKRLSML